MFERRALVTCGMLSGFLSGVSLCVGLLSGLAGYYLAAAVAFVVGVRVWFYAATIDRVRQRTLPRAHTVGKEQP
jgi:type IV secretory pathway TrbD component